jgi:phosphate-selective porin OprO/OprP
MPLRPAWILAVLLVLPTGAAAHSVLPVLPPEDTTDAPQVEVGTDGFAMTSADGDYALRIGADLQVDGRFALGDVPRATTNTFQMRRVRPKFTATLAGRYTVNVMPNFASGSATLQNAFLDVRLTDGLTIRAGQFKMPVGLEFIQSPNNLLLAERGFPTGLVPLRDLGVVLTGRVLDGALQYHAGIANGVADGANGFGDVDPKKDAVGRLYARPVQGDDVGIGIGAGGTFGYRSESTRNLQIPSYRTIGGQTVFRYWPGSGSLRPTRASGVAARVVPQTYVHAGPVGVLGEYVLSRQEVTADVTTPPIGVGTRVEQLNHQAWQAAASVVVTGEDATFGRLVPDRPFDPSRGQWGALQLSGRVQQIVIDDATFPTFANPETQAERVTAFGGAVQWILDANARLVANYTATQAEMPTGEELLDPEHLLLLRLQLAF